MLAKLYAIEIMNGRRTFSSVPKLLKEKVKQILIDSGMEELLDD